MKLSLTKGRNKHQSLSYNKAKLYDIIEFTRKDKSYQGKVIMIREKSVIVQFVGHFSHLELDYKNNRTVVSHQKYKIISQS